MKILRRSKERRDEMESRARKPMLEKQTYLKYGFVIMEHEACLCPRCGHILNAGPGYQPKYCSECGQKMNFTDIVWTEDKKLGFADERGQK